MWTEYHEYTDSGASFELCYADGLYVELQYSDSNNRKSLLELSGDEAVELATNLLQCASRWRTVQETMALAKSRLKGE